MMLLMLNAREDDLVYFLLFIIHLLLLSCIFIMIVLYVHSSNRIDSLTKSRNWTTRDQEANKKAKVEGGCTVFSVRFFFLEGTQNTELEVDDEGGYTFCIVAVIDGDDADEIEKRCEGRE